MKETKPNWGGARPGSGRKPSNIKTVTLSFRVPEEKAEVIKEAVKKVIYKKLKNKL